MTEITAEIHAQQVIYRHTEQVKDWVLRVTITKNGKTDAIYEHVVPSRVNLAEAFSQWLERYVQNTSDDKRESSIMADFVKYRQAGISLVELALNDLEAHEDICDYIEWEANRHG